jgi:hypothetical protein
VSDSKFDLGDYVEVKDRIRVFYEFYGQGRLVTERYELTREPDDKPKVIVEAAAYRSPEDQHPGRGLSWMYLPGSTSYTKGSELENTETSAWGRAIGALGILIDHSIASGNEVRNKAGEEAQTNGGLIGTAGIGKPPADFELRATPTGQILAFRLSDGRKSMKVVAHDALAESLAAVKDTVVGQRVQCWGVVSDEKFTPKGSTKEITYQVLALNRIETPDFVLPAPDSVFVPDSGGSGSEAEPSADTKDSDLDAELAALPMFAEDPAA